MISPLVIGWAGSTSHYAEREDSPETLCGIRMSEAMGGWLFNTWDVFTFATKAECKVCCERFEQEG